MSDPITKAIFKLFRNLAELANEHRQLKRRVEELESKFEISQNKQICEACGCIVPRPLVPYLITLSSGANKRTCAACFQKLVAESASAVNARS
jgi:hypothetical protein